MRNWTAIDWTIAATVAGIVAVVAIAGVAQYRLDRDHPCIRAHVEHRLQYLLNSGGSSGGFSVPVYGDETVCDERRP